MNIRNLSQKDKQKLAALREVFANNPMIWGYIFLSEHFRDKPAYFHKEIIDSAMRYPKLAVAAPRGHAKSTVLSFLYTIHAICFQRKRFIALFSNTKDKAANFLDRIKVELQENEALSAYHGKPKFRKDAKDDIVLSIGDSEPMRVISRGEDGIQNIRGEIKGAYRPDLIIIDDVEYQELVDSPERRQKLKTDFNQALMPAGDIKTCQYIAIGTILHFDSLMADLVNTDKYTDWHKLFYKAVLDEDEGVVLWEDRIPLDYLLHIKKTDPITYAKEYQNNPISGELSRFKQHSFRYYEDTPETYSLLSSEGLKTYTGNYRDCVPTIACDLAWSTKKTADYTVIMSVLLDPNSNYIIHSYLNERGMRPDRFATKLFEQVEYLYQLTGQLPHVGFEKAMLERVSKHLLKEEMAKRKQYFVIKDLKWEADKISRIEVSLEAKYANNIIYHRKNMAELEDQLIQFPYSAHDDIVDALAGAVGMLKYPKHKSTKPAQQSEDPMFDWIRNNMLPNRHTKPTHKGEFLFGNPKTYNIPSKKSFMVR